MKTWNVIVKTNLKEPFVLKCPAGERKVILSGTKGGQNQHMYSTNIFDILAEYKLVPSPVVSDLLNLALSVYTADQLISRAANGFQGWSRHLKLYIPVKSVAIWSNVKSEMENLLSFLSGDKWELFLRDGENIVNTNANPTNEISKVALFSGGLDSYISAINLLESSGKICFVSHYKGGTESSVQSELYKKMREKYPDRITSHQIRVQPNQKHKSADKENTSRARSFLFLCLGLTFANCYGETIEFIVPENGLISLNVPLTGTRLGSHSTRTTHPFFLQTLEKIIHSLGINNPIRNPYQFDTKGEMMLGCKNQEFLKNTYQISSSCSHPDVSRYAGETPGMHCGYCVPCIIRQAAEFKSNMKKTKYVNSVKKFPPSPLSGSGRDLRAFKLGLEHLKNLPRNTVMFDLLSVGPLPFANKQILDKYIDIYLRGMDEVKEFLK